MIATASKDPIVILVLGTTKENKPNANLKILPSEYLNIKQIKIVRIASSFHSGKKSAFVHNWSETPSIWCPLKSS